MDAAGYYDLLRPVFEGRRWVLGTGMVVGVESWLRRLAPLGVTRPLLLAEGVGTGTMPPTDSCQWLVVCGRSDAMMASVHDYEQRLESPPAYALAALAAYDPDGSAGALVAAHLDTQHIGGRPALGARWPTWSALEDKIVIDALWDRAGVARAPTEVVPATLEALAAAASRIDVGDGTVWCGDAREGFNGGASFVRRVRNEDHARDAAAFFGEHCDLVRVMPFLEGVPCSVHGMVFEDAVAVFRPVEMVVLRRPGGDRFSYSGYSTFWDPRPDDREAMRDVARRAGEQLRQEVGYRGSFTVDGVLTADGFLPTELNARFGAALAGIAGAFEELPLQVLDIALKGGADLDWQPRRLEALVVELADTRRTGSAYTLVEGASWHETTEHELVREPDGELRAARDGEHPDATLLAGPSRLGGFLRFTPDPARVPIGPPMAPLACAAWRYADRALGADLGPLEAAPWVR